MEVWLEIGIYMVKIVFPYFSPSFHFLILLFLFLLILFPSFFLSPSFLHYIFFFYFSSSCIL